MTKIIPTVNTVKQGLWSGTKDALKYGGAGASIAVGRAVAGAFGGAVAAHTYAGVAVKDNVDKKIIRGNAWMDAVVAMLS